MITSDEKKLHSEISVRDDAVLDIDDHGIVQQCPVHAILLQAQSLKPGHGSLKPPKKSGKSHKSSEISKHTSKSSGSKSKPPKKQGKSQKSSDSSSSGSNLSNEAEASDANLEVTKPHPIVCKKRIGSCSHEIIFGDHYNKAAWLKYADYVRAKKSTVQIDPEYVP